jgi:8-oxo-dGTP pyrophosphatase MutT (NUDIX family)
MAIPEFIADLRTKIGTDLLWLTGVTAVVLRKVVSGEPEVLLIRRSDNRAWTAVTGVLDPGEEPATAAAREVLEEAGVIACAERLAWVHVLPPMRYDNGDLAQYLDLTFRCSYISGDPIPDGDETLEAAWYALDALPPMTAEMADRIRLAAGDDPTTRFET